jgi:hypothetical protein
MDEEGRSGRGESEINEIVVGEAGSKQFSLSSPLFPL